MPRSGNRLVQRLLQRHGFLVEVRHYGMRKDFKSGGGPDCAVLVLRESDPHWSSCSRDHKVLPMPPRKLDGSTADLQSWREIHSEHFWPTLHYLAELWIPVLLVNYEAIVKDPELEGIRIVEFAGGPKWFGAWKGWGEEIFDGNAKWKVEA